jgi:hypothetical protein
MRRSCFRLPDGVSRRYKSKLAGRAQLAFWGNSDTVKPSRFRPAVIRSGCNPGVRVLESSAADVGSGVVEIRCFKSFAAPATIER